MQPNNYTAFAPSDNEAPDEMAHRMYAMLTAENKEKVIRFVEILKEAQCTPTL